MFYLSMETAWGWVCAAWSAEGLAAVTLPEKNPSESHEFLTNKMAVRKFLKGEELSRPAILFENMPVEALASVQTDLTGVFQLKNWLTGYFSGQRFQPDIKIDWTGYTLFQKQVLEALRQIPCGQVLSYCQLAEKIGRPRAARAVGNALSANRHLLVLPCHRVIRQDGSLGGFAGRPEYKKRLLAWESEELRKSL
ncbi:methylated-DNA/protein-cysteinemethyltransferase [Desulfofarcimen acetoxidans DSM 771]|uniref:methylated-DNA--[protein]-cysteine S-methyltransferase n=1 Tax=Desulfofarcimen acetoxidans (strain ATCC 49208 / DSM 771 / KCTC 5769 / VKM B-1644 / 5575) TaxID=485916 RepID=C8W5U3_DESAS|nr:methylated-DNA--[protein]-cysteine S-methyltransferase [Desulfofarcimen acetoxidans]ACV64093.1 methylated-DNA/protein-cysteinemethyltransferase [Desulfofarcimen acetoxidans DSM 771]